MFSTPLNTEITSLETFESSSANALNLVLPKNLSFGKGIFEGLSNLRLCGTCIYSLLLTSIINQK